jgi:hypothetical protein
MIDLPDHVRRNRAFWDERAKEYAAPAEETGRVIHRRGVSGAFRSRTSGFCPPMRRTAM